jgi:predicted AlkP superfamily pyrophosphatase or phosphodiesterase
MHKQIKTGSLASLILALLLFVAGLSSFKPFASSAESVQINDLRPTVILISLDGFRYDYLDKYHPPTLNALAREGVRAKWMTPSFPSKTFPNHYAIVTGLYPQDNGIVENSVYDPVTRATFAMSDRQEVQNGRWWLGEPIWITGEKQGQRTAPLFWPGSEAEILGHRPAYWVPYDHEMRNDQRVAKVLSWLDLPANKRPTFLTLYFSDVDSAGHDFSPDSPETRNAVLKVDHDIAGLLDGLKHRGILEQVNLIIISDHGMAIQDPNHTIVLDELFDTRLAEKIFWTGEIVSIFPKQGKEDEIRQTLAKALPKHARVYRKADLPARFHYSSSPRIAPLLVLPDEGWTLTTRDRLEKRKREGNYHLRGGHGYDNQLTSMRAIFIAHGPAFKKRLLIEPFENVQIYNLMARILGLRPAPNDGNDSLIIAALTTSLQQPR